MCSALEYSFVSLSLFGVYAGIVSGLRFRALLFQGLRGAWFGDVLGSLDKLIRGDPPAKKDCQLLVCKRPCAACGEPLN